ncbi:MAG: hypothetical protein JSV36_00040 [Anaerolineae bacterium]|nr:MAG: hypothetical protein JSV36_00040 [Anaerolineae bacterium]
MTIEVALPTEFTQEHAAALGQYFQSETRLNRTQWELVWDGVDILRQATIALRGRGQTFANLYDNLVDRVYADPFIEALYHFDDVARQAEQRRAAVARQIVADLREAGYYDHTVPETQWVLIFCLYWWQSFSKGYAFEVEILRDLAASGILHQAHDLRDRQARLASFDLTVMGFRGDIRTSTYFFAVERGKGLPHDFYITRLWNRQTRRWQGVTMLKPDFWAALDGETRPSQLGEVLDVLPDAVEIRVDTQKLVVIEYQQWKERVRARQGER